MHWLVLVTQTSLVSTLRRSGHGIAGMGTLLATDFLSLQLETGSLQQSPDFLHEAKFIRPSVIVRTPLLFSKCLVYFGVIRC